jgi:hypothetical protein
MYFDELLLFVFSKLLYWFIPVESCVSLILDYLCYEKAVVLFVAKEYFDF